MNLASNEDYRRKREQLLADGFCIIEDVLTPEFVAHLRLITDRLIIQYRGSAAPAEFSRERRTKNEKPCPQAA